MLQSRILTLLLLILLMVSTSFSGVRRIVLMEEATSANCAPCAANNPKMQSFFSNHFGGVISVRYHTWWPSPADPMYSVSATDVRNRIGYYSINSVPNYRFDGIVSVSPSDQDVLKQKMNDRLSQESPIKIAVYSEVRPDSMFIDIEVTAVDDVPQSDLVLHSGIIERMISYGLPPGNNGENEFPDVLRKMLPSADGTELGAMNAGYSQQFSFKAATNSKWNTDDLCAVAWIQSKATKEIIQANIDFPTFVMRADFSSLDLLSANSAVHKNLKIKNENDEQIDIRITAKNVSVAEDWDWTFNWPGGSAREFEVSIAPGDSLVFELQVMTSDRGSAQLSVFAENMSDPGFYGYGYGYGFKQDYFGLVPENNDVLIVDDDGGAAYEKNFQTSLDKLNAKCICVPRGQMGLLNEKMDLNNFKLLIWNVSFAFPALVAEDVQIMTDYLDGGGSVALFGQDICWDIFDMGGNSNFKAARDLINNYFDVKYMSDNSSGIKMQGVAGDPISDGLAFSLLRPYGFSSFYPEEVSSYSGTSQGFLKYNNGKTGAIRYDSGSFKTLYFGIGLEQIDKQENRDLIIERMLEWAAGITDVPEYESNVPSVFALEQNFPNPFNPETVIRYSLAANCSMDLSVYNILGQKVATLVSGPQQSGNHRVEWNASGYASGIYYYKMSTDQEFVSTKKLVLMR